MSLVFTVSSFAIATHTSSTDNENIGIKDPKARSLFKRKWDSKCICKGSYCRRHVQYARLSYIVTMRHKILNDYDKNKLKLNNVEIKNRYNNTCIYTDLSYSYSKMQHTLNTHKNQAGWPWCLLHLRKWSVSTLLSSRRAAGQTVSTERGFPTHSNTPNTYRLRLKTRQTDKQTDIHSLSAHPYTTSSIKKSTLPLSLQALVPLMPNTPPPTLTDKPLIPPSE